MSSFLLSHHVSGEPVHETASLAKKKAYQCRLRMDISRYHLATSYNKGQRKQANYAATPAFPRPVIKLTTAFPMRRWIHWIHSSSPMQSLYFTLETVFPDCRLKNRDIRTLKIGPLFHGFSLLTTCIDWERAQWCSGATVPTLAGDGECMKK